MLTLRSLRAADDARIKEWPPYRGMHGRMDYALREGGWLDAFAGEPDTACYAAEGEGALVGFGLLIGLGGAAELRLAVHPRQLGRGYGRALAELMLQRAFGEHSLAEVRLIVRRDNHLARALYHNLGFRLCGETTRPVMGEDVAFFVMSLPRHRFCNRRTTV